MSSIFAAHLKNGDGNLPVSPGPNELARAESQRSIPMRPVWLDFSIVFKGSVLLIQDITLSGISVRCALHFVAWLSERHGVMAYPCLW